MSVRIIDLLGQSVSKCEKIIYFFSNYFSSKCPPWKPRMEFWHPCLNFLLNIRKFFFQTPKKNYTFIIYKFISQTCILRFQRSILELKYLSKRYHVHAELANFGEKSTHLRNDFLFVIYVAKENDNVSMVKPRKCLVFPTSSRVL